MNTKVKATLIVIGSALGIVAVVKVVKSGGEWLKQMWNNIAHPIAAAEQRADERKSDQLVKLGISESAVNDMSKVEKDRALLDAAITKPVQAESVGINTKIMGQSVVDNPKLNTAVQQAYTTVLAKPNSQTLTAGKTAQQVAFELLKSRQKVI